MNLQILHYEIYFNGLEEGWKIMVGSFKSLLLNIHLYL
jgi:hypothetical protein